VVTVGALADCDYGRWCGQTFDDVQREEPAAVDAWLADPDAVPHGGESVRALLTRVATWLDVQTQHAGVVVGRRSRSAAASTSRLSGCSPALDGRREARVPPPAAGRAAISGRCPTATSCASAPRRGGRNVDPPERTCRMLDEASAA
jgi:hypothetical protein